MAMEFADYHDSIMRALDSHEAKSSARAESVKAEIHKHTTKGEKMGEVNNIFKGHGMGGGDGMFGGGGLAAGGLGGLILGALLGNRNGLFGGGLNGGDACNNTAANVVQELGQISTLSKLGDIQAAINLAACQTESTVERSAANTNQGVLAQTIALQQNMAADSIAQANGFAQTRDAIANSSAAMSSLVCQVNQNVLNGTAQTVAAVNADGEKTRALISSIENATLNRQLSDANAAIIELRNEGRLNERTRGIEINMSNNQAQAQAQTQAQLQNQALLTTLTGLIGEIQHIKATNQAFNFGSGTQLASPVNTNNNVRT